MNAIRFFSFIIVSGMLCLSCSPYFLSYDNPADPKAESYQGYKTVASADQVTADWPEEGAEITWCVFRSSVVVDGGSDRYALQIDESADDFSDPVYESLDSASNIFYPNLTEGIYKYRVKARPAGGEWPEGWSDAVAFTAVSGVDAESVSPASGDYTTDTTPLLDWNDITGAVTYQVEFAGSEAALDGSGAVSVDSSGYQIPDTGTFTVGKTCYWRVRGVNEDGVAGVWSGVFDFSELEIGDTYAGGLVFYIADGGWGLTCAESDQSTGIIWGGYDTDTYIGGTSNAVGTGAANTTEIVSELGSGWLSDDYAAKLCYKLDLNGYTDWFLPSRYELDLMYQNLHLQGLGGFGSDEYWSSSEANYVYAWYQYFGDGSQDFAYKDYNYSVRAVRAFSY